MCMPQGWIRDSSRRWFCPICVRNEWHLLPPSASSLAASPDLVPAESSAGAADNTTGPINHQPASGELDIIERREPQTAEAGFDNEHATRTVLTVNYDDLGPQRDGDISSKDTVEQRQHAVQNAQQSEPSSPSATRQEGPPATRRHRKSRFSTLPREVEDSVSVIYRELESIHSLRKQVAELHLEKARLLQIIKIRDQDISALSRQMESRVPDAELERLKASAAELDSVILDLRKENAALKTDLRTAGEQAAAANEYLNEWKEKLAMLMQ